MNRIVMNGPTYAINKNVPDNHSFSSSRASKLTPERQGCCNLELLNINKHKVLTGARG